ncbi:MAG: PorP/SprF family type IX secretion system membrane protein [Bacteroidota bacterium]
MQIKHLLIFFLFVAPFQLVAQDPYFAQFYTSPMQLNPAMIGVYEGQFRLAINYREQWGSILGDNPFRTMAASFDARQQVGSGDYIGFATSILRDEAGISNFTQNRANVGVSFLKQLGGSRRYRNGNQYLVAGLQAGVGQNGIDFSGLWFSEQYDNENESINFGASTGESLDQMGTGVFPDLSAGLLWYALFDDNMSIYAGAGMYHLNSPNITLLDGSSANLDSRIMAHVGGEIPLTDNLSILPAVVMMKQGSSMNTIAGGNFRYTNRDWRELAIRIGAWAQISNKLDEGINNAHVVATAILEMERWNIGISYDLNANITPATNARGAYELSLIYTHPEKRRRGRIRCPKL